jgi:polysaccharide export outer membrane protein
MLPLVKRRIRVEGLLPAEVESAIGQALRAEEILVDPVVTVTAVEYNSRPISVVGAVKRPITFQAVGPVTLLDAVARAEGLGPEAGSDILVSKSQRTIDGGVTNLTQRVPVRGLIDAADPELNLRLTGGEEIRVPEAGKVFVVGNVKKPGAYRIQEGAETTVFQVLALAEGLAPYAARQAYLYRREASGSKNEIPIELRRILERKAPDVSLVANDILYVPDNKGRRTSAAVIERIAGFVAGTLSGVLVYSSIR